MQTPKFSTSRVVADRDPQSRRRFLRTSGLGLATAGLFLTGCGDDDDGPMVMPDRTVNLGTGDLGVLNYAYALEQLEAAFYAEVLKGDYFNGADEAEQEILDDLEAHERAHADFFRAVLTSVDAAIPALEVDFSSIDFSNRNSVLNTAQTFEDLGVSAYNGAGKLLTTPDYLLIAGKIVSVEARHAAAIRSINTGSPTAFAGDDIIDENGLDKARTPSEVLSMASAFITTPIDASGLPQ
jgi:hypothetical protein